MPSRREAAITRSVIDVSHWEYSIDFKKVAADGIVAVIAKATQGPQGIDDTYAGYKEAAAPYRFLWGSYHFGTGAEVDVQVEHYLSTTKPNDFELVCLDFEPNPNGPTMTVDQARDFVVLLQDRTGRYPVLYGGYWLKESLDGRVDDILTKCPFRLAQYGPKPVLPVGWKKYTLWQHRRPRWFSAPHRFRYRPLRSKPIPRHYRPTAQAVAVYLISYFCESTGAFSHIFYARAARNPGVSDSPFSSEKRQ
jgi:lysozyme